MVASCNANLNIHLLAHTFKSLLPQKDREFLPFGPFY